MQSAAWSPGAFEGPREPSPVCCSVRGCSWQPPGAFGTAVERLQRPSAAIRSRQLPSAFSSTCSLVPSPSATLSDHLPRLAVPAALIIHDHQLPQAPLFAFGSLWLPSAQPSSTSAVSSSHQVIADFLPLIKLAACRPSQKAKSRCPSKTKRDPKRSKMRKGPRHAKVKTTPMRPKTVMDPKLQKLRRGPKCR